MDTATKAYMGAKSLKDIHELDKIKYNIGPDNRIRLAKIRLLESELDLRYAQTEFTKTDQAFSEAVQSYEY